MKNIFESRRKPSNPTCENDAYSFLQTVGERNQFEIKTLHKDDETALCTFTYQGGAFIVRAGVDNPSMTIQFAGYDRLAYTRDNYHRALALCHRCDTLYRYAKFTFTYDEEDNQLVFHLFFETIAPTEEALLTYLGISQRIAYEVRDYISGSKQDSLPSGGSLPEDDDDWINVRRDLYQLTLSEMAHERKAIRKRNAKAQTPQHNTIAEYLQYLFDGEQPEDLLSMTVQTQEGVQEITDGKHIASFNLIPCLVQGKGEKARFASTTPAVLTLEATTNHYVFTLHPLLDQPEFLTMRLTAVKTPHEYLQSYAPRDVYVPQAVSLKICYKKKATLKREKEPSTLPASLQSKIRDIKMQVEQFHHAHEHVQGGFYLQAIAELKPIYEEMKMRYWEMMNQEKALFYAVCYDLGHCYTQLHLYEKAYFYLDLARESDRYDCSQMYFNSLAEGRDVRIFMDLQNEIEETRHTIQNLKSEEEDEDDMPDDDADNLFGEADNSHLRRMVDYYAFLHRRLGYAQINFGYLDAAEETFRRLLRHAGSRDYAKQELKHIDELRKKRTLSASDSL